MVEVYSGRPPVPPPGKAQFHALHVGMARNALLPVVPQLQKSPVPVRVVWGTGDDIFKPTDPDSLAKIFPRFHGIRGSRGPSSSGPRNSLILWRKRREGSGMAESRTQSPGRSSSTPSSSALSAARIDQRIPAGTVRLNQGSVSSTPPATGLISTNWSAPSSVAR